VSNLDDKSVKVSYPSKPSISLDIRGSSFQKAEFMKWAESQEATVFQTHLYVFEDQLKIAKNYSAKVAPRRFLAACKGFDGVIYHYIINIPTASTEYNGVLKVQRILKDMEDVSQIVFMFNLDTGCQNVLNVFNSSGKAFTDTLLTGDVGIESAINLIAYYYE